MKTLNSLALLLMLLPLTANAQTLTSKKDLAFAQVAAGGPYKTILNLTNRGSETYFGVLGLYQSGPIAAGQPWSPLVNGTQITDGKVNIALSKGATATYEITQAGGTEAGFATITASTASLTSFAEGTLTYYVSSGGVQVDSVGVQPSSEFYLTAIPFDDFSTLALALVNLNTTGVTAKLSLYDDNNVLAATLSRAFVPAEHMAQYLYQIFEGVQMTSGRLEIQSDRPIIGTALTQVNEQLSSLPLLPAVKAYTFTGSRGGLAYNGEISLWLDGRFVEGYLRATTVGGVVVPSPVTLPLTGSIVNGVLQATTTGDPDPNQLLSYTIMNPFSLATTIFAVPSRAFLLSNNTLAGDGTLLLRAIN